IAPDVLDLLIRGSAGVMRDFIRLLQSSATNASVAGKPRVEKVEAVRSLNELRRDYRKYLTEEDDALLDAVRRTNRRASGERFDQLLRGNIVVHYADDDFEEWFDVHASITAAPWKV